MHKLKVVTVVGTRPEIIRLSRVMAALDRYMQHVIVHTGQNYDYELNQIFFEDLEIRKPDHFLEAAGATAAETIGLIIARVDAVLREIRPDAVLILGDTNSCLAAIPAKRQKIPVFHMEAGNRCFDQRVPEEINRKIVDHIADINMPYSGISREYLLREGLPPDRIIKTGSPMYEVLRHYMPRIEASDALERLGLEPGGFFLVSAHREENVDSPARLAMLAASLRSLGDRFGVPIIVSTHPRTRQRLAAAALSFGGRAQLMKPQRPEGMEEGAVMMTGLRWERIEQGLAILEGQGRGDRRTLQLVRDYEAFRVSEKVLRIIVSYTDYVRRTVWREEPACGEAAIAGAQSGEDPADT
jgi:UDP-N-acetyl-L-fucosamine synthase